MTRPVHGIVLALASVTVSASCAAPSLANRESVYGTVPSSMIVTSEELSRILHPGSLMDALERLRPAMLHSRGKAPMISIDGSPPADVSLLGSISVSSVREVRLVRSPWGVGHTGIAANGDVVVGDLILVSTCGTSR